MIQSDQLNCAKSLEVICPCILATSAKWAQSYLAPGNALIYHENVNTLIYKSEVTYTVFPTCTDSSLTVESALLCKKNSYHNLISFHCCTIALHDISFVL